MERYKNSSWLQLFRKTLHFKCWTGSWIHLGDILLLGYQRMIKVWIPLPPYLHLFNFGNLPLCYFRPNSLERWELFGTPSSQPLSRTVKFCSFITTCCNMPLDIYNSPYHKKECLNVPYVPLNTNGIKYYVPHWVKYKWHLGSLLLFSSL